MVLYRGKTPLDGTWELTAVEFFGARVDGDEAEMTFRVGVLIAGNKATFVLDPCEKPGAIDITPLDGSAKGTTFPGIYERDGETLKLCVSWAPSGRGERPKAFVTRHGQGDDVYLYTFKRKMP